MICFFKTARGNTLVGLLVAVLIIAALTYGSSFFWNKNEAEPRMKANGGNPIDALDQAKDDLAGINEGTASRDEAMKEIMGRGGKITVTSVKAGDTLKSPVLIEGMGAAESGSLVVELRNSAHQAMVIEPVRVKAPAGELGPFSINLHFQFRSTKEGYLALFEDVDGTQKNLVEIPVKFGNAEN